jgi:hypothetical protein
MSREHLNDLIVMTPHKTFARLYFSDEQLEVIAQAVIEAKESGGTIAITIEEDGVERDIVVEDILAYQKSVMLYNN